MGERSLASIDHENETAQLVRLDETFALQHSDRLAELACQIPGVDYTVEQIVATEKPDGRQLHDKWQHSFALMENGEIVGMVMGYRRDAEDNDQYPVESLYMSELAVDSVGRGQGYGRKLVERFLQEGLRAGIEYFTLQTNSDDWNEPVRRLYQSYGYKIEGKKQYENRKDVIMRANAVEISQQLTDNV